jgi:hypothetical protein
MTSLEAIHHLVAPEFLSLFLPEFAQSEGHVRIIGAFAQEATEPD